MSEAETPRSPEEAPAGRPSAPLWQRLIPWAITVACFAYLYGRLDAAAAREGENVVSYLAGVFARVSWWRWLALMGPYSVLFFLIDSLIVWRVINWFNTRVPYGDILPIRASAYIISILNEQIGKGVMAVYLNRRDAVPGWQVGSSMLFIMFCEFYYLLSWATVGTWLHWDDIDPVFHQIPILAAVAAVFLVAWVLFFNGALAPGSGIRERQIFTSFRQAKLWNYLVIVLLRSPALLAAVFVYKESLALFAATVGGVVERDGRAFLLEVDAATVEDLEVKLQAIRDEPVLTEDEPNDDAAAEPESGEAEG